MRISPNVIFDIVAFLFAISIHESAHAWSASKLGDNTARFLGRVTLNPLKHIDLVGTILFPLMGALSGLPIIGWAKPTPVDLGKLRHPRRDDILVSAAGPASNFLLAFLAVAALIVVRRFVPGGETIVNEVSDGVTGGSSLLHGFTMLAFRFLLINVLLGVFNLIPIPPLDGSAIVSNLLPAPVRRVYAQVGRYGFLLLMLLLVTNIPYLLFAPVFGLFKSLLRL